MSKVMEFSDVMSSHIVWKLRLMRCVDGEAGEHLDSAAVGRDDVCDLGRWLYGEGTQYKDMAAYQDLLRSHARFHACAGVVLRKLDDGDKLGAKGVLMGAFEAASRSVISALAALRRDVAEEGNPPAG